MRELRLEDFRPHRGRMLSVAAEGGPVDLKLVHVHELPGSPRPAGSFRLEFHGPIERFLPQGVYPFDLSGERCEIFIVPLGPEGEAMRYEAIFF